MTTNPEDADKYNVRGHVPKAPEYKELQAGTYSSMGECLLAGEKLGQQYSDPDLHYKYLCKEW